MHHLLHPHRRGRYALWTCALCVFVLTATIAMVACTPKREHLQTAPQQSVTGLSATLLYDILLANLAARQGDTDVELDALRRAATRSRDPRLLARSALSAMHTGAYTRALADARRWQKQQPQAAAPRELLAHLLLLLKRDDEAEAIFTELLNEASFKERDVRFMNVIMIMSDSGITQENFAMYQRLAAQYPRNATAEYGILYFATRFGDHALAERSLGRVLHRRAGWTAAAVMWMEFLRNSSRVEDAIAFAEEFSQRNQDDASFLMSFAKFLLAHNRQLDALRQYQRVLDNDNDHLEAHYAAAAIESDVGRTEIARAHLQHVLALDSERDDARYHLAELAYQRKDFKKVYAHAHIITDENYYLAAQFLLSATMAKTKGLDHALRSLRAMDIRGEARVSWYIFQSRMLSDEQRYVEARDTLSRALREFPDDGDLLYARALTAAHLKQIGLLERDLRKLIRQNPHSPHAYNVLGYTLADITDRYNEALSLIEKALSLRGDSPYILDSMGWVQYRLGNLDVALEFLQKAFAISPDDEIAAHLGEVLWASGQHEKSRELLLYMIKKYPQSRTLQRAVQEFGL